MLKGKPHVMGLGPVDMGKLAQCLAAARQRAQEARDHHAAGQDPLTMREAERAASGPAAAVTFEACAAEFLSKNSPDWRNPKHRQQWVDTLATYVYPIVGKLSVGAVAVDHVLAILDPIWRTSARDRPAGFAGRIPAYSSATATARGYRGEGNPAGQRRVRDILGRGRPKVRHHASIAYQQVPDLMAKIAGREDVAALALQWIALTATRSAEARFAQWSEVDRKAALWTIPAARMKAGEPHVVPLAPLALDILDRVRKVDNSPFIFVAQGKDAVSDTLLRGLLRDLGYQKDDATLHGFRSSFRDWAAENGVADDVAESVLAHTVEDKTVAAYKRTKFLAARRAVMLQWSLYVY